MRHLIFTTLAVLLVVLPIRAALATNEASSRFESVAMSARNLPAPETGALPLLFEENVGQLDPRARFEVKGRGATLFLADDGIWLTVVEPPKQTAGGKSPRAAPPSLSASQQRRNGVNVKLSFIGANPTPQLEPFDRLPSHVSYFHGSNPAGWRTDVPVWRGVRYKDLYPGLDLDVTSKNGQWAWQMVANGSSATDSSSVRLRVEGSTGIRVDGKCVLLSTGVGDVPFPLLGSTGLMVSGAVNADDGVISEPYLDTKTVGPGSDSMLTFLSSALSYSTYIGGGNYDIGSGIAVDQSGNAYVFGSTQSVDFPTTPGAFQATYRGSSQHTFVTKVDPSGTSLIYSTFLGGTAIDTGSGIAINQNGEAFVVGSTESTDFPTTIGAFQSSSGGGFDDGFVTELNATGTALIYSTFLGGKGSDGVGRIVLDGSGNAYVSGSTTSTNFPTTAGAFQSSLKRNQDAFIAKLDPAGATLIYSTYLGGSGDDYSSGLAVDDKGEPYISGQTLSSDFPTTQGAFQTAYERGDAFVTKLNSSGSGLFFSTYLGGSANDYSDGIAVDGEGNSYLVGIGTQINRRGPKPRGV